MTANSGLEACAILGAYDFSGINRIADVGGGHGLLLASILEAYPQVTGVLYDLPEVVAGVPPERMSKYGDRLEIQAGSFFEAVPAACDTYIAKHIIHDWSDEHCRKILRRMRMQLTATGRVLICDMLMPEDSAPSPANVLDIPSSSVDHGSLFVPRTLTLHCHTESTRLPALVRRGLTHPSDKEQQEDSDDLVRSGLEWCDDHPPRFAPDRSTGFYAQSLCGVARGNGAGGFRHRLYDD
jgi:hypothetical protein